MQIKSLFGLALFAGAVFASPVEKRDAKPVTDALAGVSKSIQTMTASINTFDGDGAKGAVILTQAEALLKVLGDAVKSISPIAALPLNEAVQVLQPGNALIVDVQKVTDALISKKAEFTKSSLNGVVTDTLTKLRAASDSLLKTITGKLPANVSSVGDTIGKQIFAAIDKALAAYPK
jgi:hypothetical protein